MDGIELTILRSSCIIWWALNQVASVLRKETGGNLKPIGKEKVTVDLGVMCLSVKRWQQPPEAGKGQGGSCPRAFETSMALLTSSLRTSCLHNYEGEKITSVTFSHQMCGILLW